MASIIDFEAVKIIARESYINLSEFKISAKVCPFVPFLEESLSV